METIRELRERLQTNVMGHPYLQRILSIYITRILIPTNITADQITVSMFIIGVGGTVSIFFGWIWLGFFLVYLSIILDAVDGEIARYKKVYSLKGVYLDLVNHHLTSGLFFLALTFWVADIFHAPNVLVLVIGVLGSMALILRRANGDIHRVIFIRPYNENPELYPAVSTHHKINDKSNKKEATSSFSVRKLIRYLTKVVYKLHYFAVMVIVLFLAFVSELVMFSETGGHPVLNWFIIGYGITYNIYFMREIIGEFFNMEAKVEGVASKFKYRQTVDK